MNIVNIRNNAVATIESCDKEPIHIPGTIQPQGYLLAVDSTAYTITHGSANLEQFLGKPPEAVLSRSLADFFENQYTRITSFLENEQTVGESLLLDYQNQYFHLTANRSDGLHILEFEAATDLSDPLLVTTAEVNRLLALGHHPQGLQTLCQTVVAYVKEKLGYDRVMVYRFHDDHSGEIFAECLSADMDPFFGLRYPAGDIPPQARELYLRNLLRLIPNVNYTPVPLLTYQTDDQPARQLDLSHSTLRSVSPIHIQYLKNMGVASSCSISIVKDGKLWGLISCHHNTAKYLSPVQRQAARLCGLLLSSQLEVHQRAESLNLVSGIDDSLDCLLKNLQKEELHLDSIICNTCLKTIADATGVAILVEGILYKNGETPSDSQLLELIAFLQTHTHNGTFVTQQLNSFFPSSESYAHLACGVIYQPLGKEIPDCVLWMKPGLEHTVTWAGDPTKTMDTDGQPALLTPRSSFAAWQQTIRNQSEKWHPYQVNATALFASALQKHIHLAYLKKEEEKQRLLAEKLKATNDELENMNWISVHDLKEPLRKIMVLISKLLHDQSATLPESATDTLARIHKAARKMQMLLDDIMTYARLSGKEQSWSQVNMNELLKEVFEEYTDEVESRKAILRATDLPIINGISFQLKQLFYNLIGNALKFSRPEISPQIQLTVRKESLLLNEENKKRMESFFVIEVADNGVGFPEEYKDRIFKLFQRLDTTVPGTGIGLAICKKIMENHNGFIEVQSQPGQGTTFQLYFPVGL